MLVSAVRVGVEACHVAPQVALGIHPERLRAHGSESPSVGHAAVVARVGSPRARTDETRQDRTARVERRVPRAHGVVVLIVHLEYGLRAPLSAFLEQCGITLHEAVLAAVYYLPHVCESLGITALIVIIHHHVRIKHVSHSLRHLAHVLLIHAVLPLHGQHLHADDLLQLGYHLVVDISGGQLFREIRKLQVLHEERNIAPELPQVAIVISPQHARLRRPQVAFVPTYVVARISYVCKNVVAAFHTAVLTGPETRHAVLGIGVVVHHEVPVLVVGAACPAGPYVVRHDVAHDVYGVILPHRPVGPLQRVVGRDKRFVHVSTCCEILLYRV